MIRLFTTAHVAATAFIRGREGHFTQASSARIFSMVVNAVNATDCSPTIDVSGG
jgi:hypothetical protein